MQKKRSFARENRAKDHIGNEKKMKYLGVRVRIEKAMLRRWQVKISFSEFAVGEERMRSPNWVDVCQ